MALNEETEDGFAGKKAYWFAHRRDLEALIPWSTRGTRYSLRKPTLSDKNIEVRFHATAFGGQLRCYAKGADLACLFPRHEPHSPCNHGRPASVASPSASDLGKPNGTCGDARSWMVFDVVRTKFIS